jgi:hypothetical protein
LVYVKNSLKISPDDGRITAEIRIGGHPYNKENSEKNCLSAFVGINNPIIIRCTVNIK